MSSSMLEITEMMIETNKREQEARDKEFEETRKAVEEVFAILDANEGKKLEELEREDAIKVLKVMDKLRTNLREYCKQHSK